MAWFFIDTLIPILVTVVLLSANYANAQVTPVAPSVSIAGSSVSTTTATTRLLVTTTAATTRAATTAGSQPTTIAATSNPTTAPTTQPTTAPTTQPTTTPTTQHATTTPTTNPTTITPTTQPPTNAPTTQPTTITPTTQPTTITPTTQPPTNAPTTQPTTIAPTTQPTTNTPTTQPTTVTPTTQPTTVAPTTQPIATAATTQPTTSTPTTQRTTSTLTTQPTKAATTDTYISTTDNAAVVTTIQSLPEFDLSLFWPILGASVGILCLFLLVITAKVSGKRTLTAPRGPLHWQLPMRNSEVELVTSSTAVKDDEQLGRGSVRSSTTSTTTLLNAKRASLASINTHNSSLETWNEHMAAGGDNAGSSGSRDIYAPFEPGSGGMQHGGKWGSTRERMTAPGSADYLDIQADDTGECLETDSHNSSECYHVGAVGGGVDHVTLVRQVSPVDNVVAMHSPSCSPAIRGNALSNDGGGAGIRSMRNPNIAPLNAPSPFYGMTMLSSSSDDQDVQYVDKVDTAKSDDSRPSVLLTTRCAGSLDNALPLKQAAGRQWIDTVPESAPTAGRVSSPSPAVRRAGAHAKARATKSFQNASLHHQQSIHPLSPSPVAKMNSPLQAKLPHSPANLPLKPNAKAPGLPTRGTADDTQQLSSLARPQKACPVPAKKTSVKTCASTPVGMLTARSNRARSSTLCSLETVVDGDMPGDEYMPPVPTRVKSTRLVPAKCSLHDKHTLRGTKSHAADQSPDDERPHLLEKQQSMERPPLAARGPTIPRRSSLNKLGNDKPSQSATSSNTLSNLIAEEANEPSAETSGIQVQRPQPAKPNHSGCPIADKDRYHVPNSALNAFRQEQTGKPSTADTHSPDPHLPTDQYQQDGEGYLLTRQGMNRKQLHKQNEWAIAAQADKEYAEACDREVRRLRHQSATARRASLPVQEVGNAENFTDEEPQNIYNNNRESITGDASQSSHYYTVWKKETASTDYANNPMSKPVLKGQLSLCSTLPVITPPRSASTGSPRASAPNLPKRRDSLVPRTTEDPPQRRGGKESKSDTSIPTQQPRQQRQHSSKPSAPLAANPRMRAPSRRAHM